MPYALSCPHCGFPHSWLIRRLHRKCKQCYKEWSPGYQFPIKSFRLAKREWFRVIAAFLTGRTIKNVAASSNLAYATAQKCVNILRLIMSEDVPHLLTGTCEADETYVGGSWKNKAVHIRRQHSKRGRGTSKQAIFGILQREPRQVRVWLIQNSKRRTLMPFFQIHVLKGSKVYTDGYRSYRRLPRLGYCHEWVDHDAGEYVRGDVHTQGIDGYWGLLKNSLSAHGGIRKERLRFFIGEHQWRYNFRHLSPQERLQRLYQLLKRFGGRK